MAAQTAPQPKSRSDGASGANIQNEMVRRLGAADQGTGTARMIPAEPLGAVVVRGDKAIGFQQISELKPLAGITLVGPLPEATQTYRVFPATVVTVSKEPPAGLERSHH